MNVSAMRLSASALVLALVALTAPGTQAHKPITSKYTYNGDVLPIVRDRCARCHVAGGAAPMSLLSYKESVPWAESIREELIAERMPPWDVDDLSPPVRSSGGGRPLTAREIDTLITWATGGTPQGAAASRPDAEPAPHDGRSARPDLVIPMETEYTVPADASQEIRELTLSTGLTEPRWVKAADLLPGTPSIVRDATIAVENGPVLAVWVPGDEPVAAPAGTAFRLPAGARLRVHIHYKKPWQNERTAISDRSAVGLYFTAAPAPGRELQTMVVAPAVGAVRPKPGAARPTDASGVAPVTFGGEVARPLTIVAIRPALDRPYAIVDVHARLPTGGRRLLLRLRGPRPEWARRYWLAREVELPAGSRVDVSATPAVSDAGAFSGAGRATAITSSPNAPLQIRLDVVGR